MFKTKYRVVTGRSTGWYAVQYRPWWWPIWMIVTVVPDFEYAKSRVEALKKSGTVVYKGD